MARCWALGVNLKAFRCNNEAGKEHWFCHQHRRWPIQIILITGVIGGLLLPSVHAYLWGLIAPPTKVEREEVALLGNIETTVRTILENQNTHPQDVRQFIDEQGFEHKYPLGFTLFYSDSRKTLYYDDVRQRSSGVGFDPSRIRILGITSEKIRWSGFSITTTGGGEITLDEFNLHAKAGSIFHLGRLENVSVDVESLGGSAAGVAWIIGLKPAT